MADRRQMERLIHEVTELVLARLGAQPGTPDLPAGRRAIELLLPAPCSDLAALSLAVGSLRAKGYPVRILTGDKTLEQLDRSAARESLGPQVALLSQSLAPVDPQGISVLSGVGFSLARRLLALDDDDPFVRRIARTLLCGGRVLLIEDDLQPRTSAARSPVSVQALGLLSDLARMGLRPGTLSGLVDEIEQINAADTTLRRSLSALVTETDVEQAVAAGLRQLTLTRRTIVTPLARTRAAELGLELHEDLG